MISAHTPIRTVTRQQEDEIAQTNLLEVSQSRWRQPKSEYVPVECWQVLSWLIQAHSAGESSCWRTRGKCPLPTAYILRRSLLQKGRLLMTVCVSSSTGSKYNQEFSALAVMMDTASWCISTEASNASVGLEEQGKENPCRIPFKTVAEGQYQMPLQPSPYSLRYRSLIWFSSPPPPPHPALIPELWMYLTVTPPHL